MSGSFATEDPAQKNAVPLDVAEFMLVIGHMTSDRAVFTWPHG